MAIDFGKDPSAPMNCGVPTDQFRHFSDLVDAVHGKLLWAAREAYDSIAEDPAPWCQKAMAMSSAVVNLLLKQMVVHRKVHGLEMDGSLGNHPRILEAVVGDIGEVLTAVLKKSDPSSDYTFALVKTKVKP